MKPKIRFYAIFAAIAAVIIFGITVHKISKLAYDEIPARVSPDIERVEIAKGDVLELTLGKTRLSKQDAAAILNALKKNFKFSTIRPGDFYEIVYSSSNTWSDFWYYPQGSEFFSVSKSSGGQITSAKEKLPSSSERTQAVGEVKSSLWESMTSQKVPADIILQFADIFAWQMDFLTETRDGDQFKVVYEVDIAGKKNSKIGSNVLAAEYKTGSKTFDAFYYRQPNGVGGYFDRDGKSVRSAFLKAPLQYSRISSYFTTARYHPILKIVRPHLGIDYAAPMGTPISAISDGIILFAAYKGENGNLIRIKHFNGYETDYGHMSRFASGIRPGVRVRQGQVIGYVGMTGLATGPHLDFRIKINGTPFNFLAMKTPPAVTLAGANKAAFLEAIKPYLETFTK